MKRFFAIITILGGLLPCMAVEIPEALPDYSFRAFSPDGTWAVSDDGSATPFVVMNLATGQEFSYEAEFTGGNGNFISNTGVVVGSELMTEMPAYWENGKWTLLPIPQGSPMAYANGITPDGSRIVGTTSPKGYTGNYEGMMLVPCVWDRQPDGSYGQPTIINHPVTDFSGRAPQYVTAVVVSADGKTIAGQMWDFLGVAAQPVLYTQGADGQWSYKLMLNSLFYPEGYVIPPFPGFEPDPYNYMTPDEIKRYEAAMAQWELTNDLTGEPAPQPTEFMDTDEYLKYLDDDYIWAQKYMEFEEVFLKVINLIPNFSYNNIFMTSDGKYMATTESKMLVDEGRDIFYKESTPYLINVASDSFTKYPPKDEINITVSSLLDDGAILGQTMDENYRIFDGYVLKAGAKEFIPIIDWVKDVAPATATWMEENMTHTFQAYDIPTSSAYDMTVLATGIPFSTPDGTLIGFGQYVFWDDDAYSYGYLISLPENAGVEEIVSSGELNAFALGGGLLSLKGDVKALEIYDVNGIARLSVSNPSATIDTNLPAGLYIVKLSGPQGKSITRKLIIK